eukprot:14248511-Alexandrium_andersonii.AAC.1
MQGHVPLCSVDTASPIRPAARCPRPASGDRAEARTKGRERPSTHPASGDRGGQSLPRHHGSLSHQSRAG